jgi:hypothetical protein
VLCAPQAANDLDAMIARRPVTCVDIDERSYKRIVAVCTVAGTDIADWLVRNGLALDWPQYSKGAYADAQAKRIGKGGAFGKGASLSLGSIGPAGGRAAQCQLRPVILRASIDGAMLRRAAVAISNHNSIVAIQSAVYVFSREMAHGPT